MLTSFFFFNDTATTEIYTLSLHDALPISAPEGLPPAGPLQPRRAGTAGPGCQPRGALLDGGVVHRVVRDRKSTRLNSSHGYISYAVFCLKKKKSSLHGA